MDLKKGGNYVDIFNSVDEVIDSITDCKDKKEAKAALRAAVGFAMHDKEATTSGIDLNGLPKKVTLTILMHGLQSIGKFKEGD